MESSFARFRAFCDQVNSIPDSTPEIGDDLADQYNAHLQRALELHPEFQPMDLQRQKGTSTPASLKAAVTELREAWNDAEGQGSGSA